MSAVDLRNNPAQGKFAVVNPDGSNLSAGGGLSYSSGAIARPANTTAYTAGDVFGAAVAAITIALGAVSGSSVMITSTRFQRDVSAVASGETSYTLHLYSVTPPSAPADNAAWDLPSGDRASYLGFIDLGTPVDLGSTIYVQQTDVNRVVRLAGTDLFGLIVTNGAYTPGSADVFRLTVDAVQL